MSIERIDLGPGTLDRVGTAARTAVPIANRGVAFCMLPKLFATSLALALLSAAPAVAQATLTVSPLTLTQGENTTITYSNPAMAGQSVTIDIDNGRRRNPQSTTVTIELDDAGRGSVEWCVPAWQLAKFNAPGAPEVFCPVVAH